MAAEMVKYMIELEKKLTNNEIAGVGLWLEYRVRLLTADTPDADTHFLAAQAERRLQAIEATHQQRVQAIMERFQP